MQRLLVKALEETLFSEDLDHKSDTWDSIGQFEQGMEVETAKVWFLNLSQLVESFLTSQLY